MNRSEFLIRQLEYYAATNYPYRVAVADSSDDHHRSRIEAAIARLKDRLKVAYHHLPKTNDYTCLKHLVDTAQTPYAVYCGDDDFFFTSGALKAVEFLEGHAEYTGANGRGIIFTLDNTGPYGRFVQLGEYVQKGIEQTTAKDRLLGYTSDYSVLLFSVQRIAVWQKMYQHVHRVPDRCMGGETLPCFLSAIYGRIKHLDHLYMVRQVHDQRYLLPDIYDWLTGPLWGPSFQLCRSFFVDALKETDGMDSVQAEQIVKQAVWRYLKDGLWGTYYSRYCPTGVQVLFWKIFRKWQFIAGYTSRLNLDTLLSPQSPYAKDFIPLHKCVTQTKGETKMKGNIV